MSENLLHLETSPYLLQHKDNPVHWRPWGRTAFEEAERTGKPILLSVGYAACHWCHVMAHESFEDADVAAVMNRLFVNVKVDREERPDVDQIYMSALHALGEQGGWPLTMFLTPGGAPVWGGTYFPKTPRFGRPGFVAVLEEIARIFRDEPEKIETNKNALTQRLAARSTSAGDLNPDILDRAAEGLLGAMDDVHGGIKGAPKFPNASVLELLWRAFVRTGNTRYRETVLLALERIANGGIYDHIGGGFARYSVDERWLAPHFEKMLYDNAQVIGLMTSAWLVTKNDLFRRRIEETVDWLSREMIVEGGAFAASLDADSEGEEGRFYVWSRSEIDTILGDDAKEFSAIYDISAGGNWDGKNIPNRLNSAANDDVKTEQRLSIMRARLLEYRETRVRPGRDDKVLADWNGLMIAALTRAASVFDKPTWLERAETAFHFISESMSKDGILGHSLCAGHLIHPGLATDHAAMADAALALFRATGNRTYLDAAITYTEALESHFADGETGGYYLTAASADDLIIRPKSPADEATPNANGIAARMLVHLWALTGKDLYRDRADAILRAFSSDIPANVFATASLLNAFDFRLNPVSVVVVGDPDSAATSLLQSAQMSAHPNIVLFGSDASSDLSPAHPAFGKMPLDSRETAYICHGDRCGPPVTTKADLKDQLGI